MKNEGKFILLIILALGLGALSAYQWTTLAYLDAPKNEYRVAAGGIGKTTVVLKREADVNLWNGMTITVIFPNVKPELSEEEWAEIRHEMAVRLAMPKVGK